MTYLRAQLQAQRSVSSMGKPLPLPQTRFFPGHSPTFGQFLEISLTAVQLTDIFGFPRHTVAQYKLILHTTLCQHWLFEPTTKGGGALCIHYQTPAAVDPLTTVWRYTTNRSMKNDQPDYRHQHLGRVTRSRGNWHIRSLSISAGRRPANPSCGSPSCTIIIQT